MDPAGWMWISATPPSDAGADGRGDTAERMWPRGTAPAREQSWAGEAGSGGPGPGHASSRRPSATTLPWTSHARAGPDSTSVAPPTAMVAATGGGAPAVPR
jgi:hypothetical protein